MAATATTSPPVIAPDARPWTDLKGSLHDRLLAGLDGLGYRWMTPVQKEVLTKLPTLSSDCLVQAKTGTGKTIAFLLPALQALLTQDAPPHGQVAVLVLSPTRELALQIAKECDALTARIHPRPECHAVYGGGGNSQKDRDMRRFCDGDPKIVVATPGRLNDYLSDDYIAAKFSHLRTLVLDEADQMLETGFLVALNLILQRLPPKSQGWQGMCFSATVPKKVEGVLPKVLRPGYTRLSTVDPDETPTIDQVTQHSIVVPSIADVYPALLALLQKEHAISADTEAFKVIVFGTTANGVALMYTLFSHLLPERGIQVSQLQSRLSQNARTATTDAFKAAPAGAMFATDVVGRGMDFPNVTLVVQVGLPSSTEQYVHRVGRTARAGNVGRAVILLTHAESFFLNVGRHLPITPYPHDLASGNVPAGPGAGLPSSSSSDAVANALAVVDPASKAKAYQAWLGFHKMYTKQLQLTNEGLVRLANDYAAATGCPEPPEIEKRIVGKMGLKGVRGLNVVSNPPGGSGGGGGGGRQGNRVGGRGDAVVGGGAQPDRGANRSDQRARANRGGSSGRGRGGMSQRRAGRGRSTAAE